jgi:hypothetical protein
MAISRQEMAASENFFHFADQKLPHGTKSTSDTARPDSFLKLTIPGAMVQKPISELIFISDH